MLLTLKIPTGIRSITLHYEDHDSHVKLPTHRIQGDRDYFLSKDGTVIPQDIPVIVDIVHALENIPHVYNVTDEQLDRAEGDVRKILKKMKEPKLKTAVRLAVRRLDLNHSKVVEEQLIERVRQRIRRTKQKLSAPDRGKS